MRPAAIHVVGIAALLLVFGPWTAVAQEEEGGGRDLEDILKDVVRDAVEDQGSSNLGRVARVSVVRRAASVVDLSVDVEGISDPGRVTLRVEVFDSEYRTLPGFESSHGPIPAGDGSVAVSVVYGAVEDVQSVGLKVGLVDTETQRMFSRRKAALPWEWGGGTGGGASAGLSTLSSRGSGDQPSRQPVVVSIEPSRVGDTPAMEIPTIVGVRVAQQPTPMAQGPPTGGTSAAPGVLGTATKVQPTVVDLYSAAARATWTSDAGRLTFGGETGDTRGYVRALGDAKLNDGQVHHKVLQTHPAFKDNGRIAGAFAVTVPKGATAVSAGGGFLPNVTRSDGVKVVVKIGRTAAESTAVVSKMVRPADGIVKIAGAIPAEMQGKDVILTLEVQAGPTSTQDWFVWVEPAIR